MKMIMMSKNKEGIMEECYALVEKEFIDTNVTKNRIIQLDISPIRLREYANLLNSGHIETRYNFKVLKYEVISIKKGENIRI